MFKLVIQDDEGKTTVVPLIRDEITIGRKEGNTIRLTERNVSRRHARIVRANGAVAIEDLGSYNGVRVNGTRIAQRTSLTVSDRVQIGDYLIELKAEGVEHVTDDGKTQPIERMDPGFVEAQIGTATTMPPSPATATAAPPPTPVVALADTDPAARAIPPVAVPIGQTSGHARLVVLSSNFAGQEWELSRAQMIIGRTDDNDLVINHRSISRNHAKFVRESDTGRYTISDLQSSNGVRVNGEEYGKVELRRGDVIDLGHVRLRFVEPGEDFLFGRDAQIADVPTGSKSKGLMIAAAVVLLGVAGVAVFMLTRTDPKPKNPVVGDGTGSDKVNTPALVPDAATAIVVATVDAGGPANTVGTKLAECRKYRDAEDWINVVTCAKIMLENSPANRDAQDLIDQATREARNKLTADEVNTAVRTKDYQGAVDALKKIPADSIYLEKARASHDKLRADFIAEEVTKAKAMAQRHDCKTKDKRADQVGKIWSEASAAINAINCETRITAPPPECKNDGDCGGGKACKSGSCVRVEAPQPECDAVALLNEARAAGGANQWSKVLAKAEASNKCVSSKSARQLALLAACNIGDKAKAMRYWKEFENNTGMQQRCVSVIK
jgi:pSer/pThr/pTyr-binding forkhead associated (FHA) protein